MADDEDDRRGRTNLAKELSFFEKVKTRCAQACRSTLNLDPKAYTVMQNACTCKQIPRQQAVSQIWGWAAATLPVAWSILELDRGMHAKILVPSPGDVGCRIRSREQYQDFLKCLNLFAQDIIAKGELQIIVQDILGRYPDLLVGPPASKRLLRHRIMLHD